jgi:hypothetical protein
MLSWPKIEERFARHFNLRAQNGLTSEYYRIRKWWDMEEVRKSGADGRMDDRIKVESKALHFSVNFLQDIGYFD